MKSLLFLLAIIFVQGCLSENPIVQTPSGPVQGFTLTTHSGKEVDAYFGIPYAKPPVGERKFKKPEPVEPWTETLKAFSLPNACPRQPMQALMDVKEQSDDCLYLTIAVPKGKSENKKVPVLVKIHGGGFQVGSAGVEWGNSTTLAAEENIIVVSMNYRLGIVGFLYLGSENAPGNMGLWDQSLALKWIKENIESFGGDPDSITIIGESAGGASVSFHSLSPYSHPYFNRVISESGMANSPWAIQDKKTMSKMVKTVAEKTGCAKPDVEEMIACLRDVDSDTLIAESEKIKNDELLDLGFVPVVDGDFVKRHPEDLIRDGEFKKCDYMVGAADEEGILFARMFLNNGNLLAPSASISKSDITKFASYLAPSGDHLIRNIIEYFYTNWTDPNLERNWWNSADKIFGDYYFTCAINDFSDSAVKHGVKVYRHVFGEQIKFLGSEDKHAFHGAQIGFVYGTLFNKENVMSPYVPEYEEASRKIMRTRANFARSGNPNKSPDGSSPRVTWPEYTLNNKEYFLQKADEDSVGYGYRDNYCAFWRELMPKLVAGRESCPV